MTIIDPNSLAGTVDAVNEVFFYGHSLTESDKERIATWIAERQGRPGSYANMFAPTEKDYREGVRLFSGEKVRSGAGIGHVVGEEACRALILLDVSLVEVRGALDRATSGMMEAVARGQARGLTPGMYCCGTCTPAFWRHLAAGGLEDSEQLLAAGMEALKSHRDGKGRWRRFPFHYTLLALGEIGLPYALEEMRYASSVCERYLRRAPKEGKYALRRRDVAERVLENC